MKKDKVKSGAFCGGYDKAQKENMKLFNLMGKMKGGKLPMKDMVKKITLFGNY